MKIQEIMTKDPATVTPGTTVRDAAKLMQREDTGILPVVESEGTKRLVGVVTDRDIAIRAVAEGKGPDAKVREVMTPDVKYCFEDDDVDQVTRNMADNQVRRLPVLDRDKRLVGIVSLGDLATEGQAPRLAGRALAGVAREGGQHNQLAAD